VLYDIRNEFGKPKPESKKILKVLYQLGKDAKKQKITDSEFFDAVGETFRMQPEFFMNELYPFFIEKMANIIGGDKRREMERHILEKFCLLGDERIIYEFKGNITQIDLMEQKENGKSKNLSLSSRAVELSVSSGDIFLTNHRLIAHGLFEVFGDRSMWAVSWRDFVPTWREMLNPWVKQKRLKPGPKAIERGKALVASIFGYQFPTKEHGGVSKIIGTSGITYSFEHDKLRCLIQIKLTDKRKKRNEDLNNIFDMLSGGPDEVLDVIRKIYKIQNKGKVERWSILLTLKRQLKREESALLSNTDKTRIIFHIFLSLIKLGGEYIFSFQY
jgi:hypothetical protein